MSPEQVFMLRQLAEGQSRPDGDDRTVSRLCGGLVTRQLAVRSGSCCSRIDPNTMVAEYQILPAGVAFLRTHDAGIPRDLVKNGDGPEYIVVTLARLAAGAGDVDDVASVVRRAGELGLDDVRLTVARVSEVRAGRGGTIRMLGRDGPRSSEDVTPARVDDALWTAVWRVSDIKLWLRAVPPRLSAGSGQAAAS
jgi:hypothetical protein